MSTENDEHPDYRRIGWRRDMAKKLCALLNFGPTGLEDLGINAEEAVIDVLLGHRCAQEHPKERSL